MIPTTLMLIHMIYHMNKIRKHDKVLFRFCQLRRDILQYLREKGNNLPEKDYKEIRTLVDLVNDHIHHFDDHKSGLFRLNGLFSNAKSVYTKVRKSEEKKVPNNKKIEAFYNSYGKSLLIAFLTYTPFLASKIIVLLLIKILELIKISTGHFLSEKLDFSESFLKWLRSENNGLKPSH